jgi:hypothetical protein
MQTLFEQLSAENQNLVIEFGNIDLTESLNNKKYAQDLTVRDLVMITDIFKLNHYSKSFSGTVLDVFALFNC